jgi:CRP-like cAMP-binding protein/sugar phosphate permease
MAHPAAPSSFAVFRRRTFRLMWTGQLISTTGSALTSLASSILVYRVTGSALSVGLMLMATAAPSLLVGLIAGVFVDRFDRRRIMIFADVLRAALVLLIPFLITSSIAWLYVINMLAAAVGQFFDPAYESVLPEAASEEELAAANSMMAISSFGSTAIGFAASGLIASRFPIQYAFYLDALSFLISAICIAQIRVRKVDVQEKTSVGLVLRNLGTGIQYLSKSPVLRSLFFVSIPVLFCFGLENSLLLPFATQALKASEFEYGLQEGLTSVGFVVASLLLARLFDRWREGQWLVISYIGMGIAGILYSRMEVVWMAVAIQMLSGFMNAPAAVARRTVIQRSTPFEMRGRVASAFFVSRDTFFLIGMAAAGLADLVDVRLLYLIASLLLVGSGLWVLGLPGLGQPAAEWRRALALLRSAPAVSGLGAGRMAMPADIDLLAGLIPSLAGLSRSERDKLAAQGRMIETPAGAALTRSGDRGDCAYFILAGKAVAGVSEGQGNYRSLSSMTAGDFFGEIAALTGAARTADVVAEEPVRLLEVPAALLRTLMAVPAFSQLVLNKMSERLARTSIHDLPRFAGVDQQAARELREEPQTV